MILDPALVLPLAWFLAATLAVAATHKVMRQREFMLALDGYGLTPRKFGPAIAYMLATAEAVCAAMLVVPALSSAGAIFAATIFGGYGIVMIQAIVRGRSGIDCGCHFGSQPSGLGWALVFRNAALIGVAWLVALPMDRAVGWPDIVSGACAGLALLLIQESGRIVLANREWIRAIRGASRHA